MVKTIQSFDNAQDRSFDKLRIDPEQSRMGQQQDKELYQCEECGFRYESKEWAEKCEAWCKEHSSCNIEITAHGMPPASPELQRGEPEDGAKNGDALNKEDRKFITRLFYGLIGIASSLAFFLVLYWVLRLDSAITNVITNTYATPLYFWPYVVFTFGAIILFGVNVSLLVYRWRKFGPPKLKTESGAGFGSLFGIAASACPVCGSTLLSAIGIAGGLAAFPLGGLELKALSFGFLALPVWLIRKDLKKLEADCLSSDLFSDLPFEASAKEEALAKEEASAKEDASGARLRQDFGGQVCPAPKDHSFKETDNPWLVGIVAAVVVLSLISWNMLKTEPIIARALSQGIINPSDNTLYSADVSQTGNSLITEVTAKVLPEKGFPSKIALGDSVVRLAQHGVIERDKFLAIYQNRGGLPDELKDVLDKPTSKPILLTRENANYYVNLLWPLGLANYMESNKTSPINGKSLFNFASTGGWNLGREENGGAYFNKFKIVELTQEQEALVTKIAQSAYRPCCNNSTFYQDCNHGSALLGLFQLGAAQGFGEEELYREAVAFNSFWFPHNYIQTALYFKAVENLDWDKVDPKLVMGKKYSSISGWYENVDAEVKQLGLVPQQKGGAGCGV